MGDLARNGEAAGDKKHFVGMPSPMAATALAAIVFAFPESSDSKWMAAATAILVFGLAGLMISRLRYRSFREVDLRNRRSYIFALPIAAILIAVAFHPKTAILGLCTVYLFSAPLSNLWGLVVRGRSRESAADRSAASDVADEPLSR